MIAVTGASVTFCRLPSRTRGFSRSFAAGVEHDAHGEAVRARRAPAHQIVQGNELFTRNRLIEPLVLSARLAKDRIKRGIIKLRRHKMCLLALVATLFNSSCSSLPHRGVTRRDTRQS